MSYKDRRRPRVIERVVAPLEERQLADLLKQIEAQQDTFYTVRAKCLAAEKYAATIELDAKEAADTLVAHAQMRADALVKNAERSFRKREKELHTQDEQLGGRKRAMEKWAEQLEERESGIRVRETTLGSVAEQHQQNGVAREQKEAELRNHEHVLQADRKDLAARAVRLDRQRADQEGEARIQEEAARALAEKEAKLAVDRRVVKQRAAQTIQDEARNHDGLAAVRAAQLQATLRVQEAENAEKIAHQAEAAATLAINAKVDAEKVMKDRERRVGIREREAVDNRRKLVMEQEDHDARVTAFNRRKRGEANG